MLKHFEDSEFRVLLEILKDWKQEQINMGWVDFFLEVSPENLKFMEIFNSTQENEEDKLFIDEDRNRIVGSDHVITQYFISKIEKLSAK